MKSNIFGMGMNIASIFLQLKFYVTIGNHQIDCLMKMTVA